MKKVGEHVTIDFLGVKQEYSPVFIPRLSIKLLKKLKWKFLILLSINLGHKDLPV